MGRRGAKTAEDRGGAFLAREADFASLYRRHAGDLLVFFGRRTGERQSALDLSAETFAQAFAGRGRFRGGSDDEARAWLFAIGSHLLAGFLRKGYAERRMVDRLGIDVPSAASEFERIVELDAVRQLGPLIAQELGRLSREQREAVQLRVVDELPFTAIAARLGISEPAARMRVSRGLCELADALQHMTQATGDPV
jgi:RNA polymerase sigma-70 factor (ECF subfamily)